MTELENKNLVLSAKITALKKQIEQLEKDIKAYKDNITKLEKGLDFVNHSSSNLKYWLDNLKTKVLYFNAKDDSNFSKYCKTNVDNIIKVGNIVEIIDDTDIKIRTIKKKILEFEQKIKSATSKIIMLKNEIAMLTNQINKNNIQIMNEKGE